MKKHYSLCLLFLLFIGIVHSQNVPNLPCPPHVRVNVRPNPICYGDTATLTAHGSGLTYLWSTGATTSSISVSPSSNTTYYVIGTNINGCPDTVRVTVKVDPAINASISASPANPCQGATVSLMANVSGGTLPYTYAWTPASPLNSSTIYNPTYVANITRTFTCTVKDSIGCSSVATKTVTVNTPPVANADSALIHYLGGDSVTATGGTPPYTYAWSPPLSTDLAVDPPTKPVEYTLTVTDANGCSSIDSAKLTPTPNTLGGCGSIFISGYVQDTVNHDDAIELYNPTGSSINLKTYYLEGTINSNASTPPFVIHLKGTIGAHKTFLIANRNADVTLTNIAKQLSDSLNFNGKDIVTLIQIVPAASSALTTLLDKIGDLSTPYGANGWPVGMGGTKNYTLIRQQSIVEGDPIWANCKNEWNVYPQGDFNVLQKFSSLCKPGDAALTLTIENEETTCGTPSYFEFDIVAQEDSSSRFNNCVMNLQYSSSTFAGDNASNIIVTQVSPFLPGPDNDYGILNISNLFSNEIQIKFGADTAKSRQGFILNSIPQTMLHVKFPIQDCQVGTVNFDTSLSMPLSFYTDSIYHQSNSSSDYELINTQYSSTTYYNGFTSSTVCPVTILPLDNVNAGTNNKSVPANSSILTISGYGFGRANGNGAIQVSDANELTIALLDSMDIIYWSDSKIIVKMPSYLYGDSDLTPGTGPIKIYTGCDGQSNFQNLQINYNILNSHSIVAKEKIRADIAMINNSSSLIFRCDTTVVRNTAAYACIKKAIRTWNCYTGVNWKIGPDTALHISQLDGVSNIYFSNSHFSDSNILMQTKQELDFSCYNSGDSTIYYNEADINMRPMPGGHLWNYDTTYTESGGSDPYFYDAILHELGHALGLGHSTDLFSLMYPFESLLNRDSLTGGSTWPGPGTLYGAFDEVNTSSSFSNSCGLTTLHPSTVGCIDPTLSVPEIGQNEVGVTIFPDPVGSGNITASYELTENSYIQMKIADCTGRIVLSLPDIHRGPGKYSEQINVNSLAQGAYLFITNINSQFKVIKFIKI